MSPIDCDIHRGCMVVQKKSSTMINAQWCMYRLLSHCFDSVIWGVDNAWHGWTVLLTTAQPPHHSSSVLVQGPWYLYVYTTMPPFWECYIRHRQCLIGVDNTIDHSTTSNYAKDIPAWIYYLTDFGGLYEAWAICERGGQHNSQVIVQWSKENDICMDMLSHCCWSVIRDIDNVSQVWTTPRTTTEPPTSHTSLSGGTMICETNFLNHAWQ